MGIARFPDCQGEKFLIHSTHAYLGLPAVHVCRLSSPEEGVSCFLEGEIIDVLLLCNSGTTESPNVAPLACGLSGLAHLACSSARPACQ